MDKPDSISEKVLSRIEHTTPYSRTYFLLKNAGVWALAVVSVIVGALAASSMAFRSLNAGPALRPGSAPPASEILLVIPFVWIALMLLFAYVAFRKVRATRSGYRYAFWTIILGVLLASCALGFVFFKAGIGFALDRAVGRVLPFQPDLTQVQRDRWHMPGEGFLLGSVGSRTEEGFVIVDPGNLEWNIVLANQIASSSVAGLQEGQRVGIRGRVLDGSARTFLACDIRSLEFRGRGPTDERPPLPPRPGEHERISPTTRSTECEGVRPPH